MSVALESTIGGYLEALAARTPAPASGSGTAVAGALAAAIAGLAASFSNEEGVAGELRELRERLAALADEDAAAYSAYMETRSDEARDRTIEVPLAIAESAAAVRALAEELAASGNQSVRGDAEAAAELAGAAARIGARLVEINLGDADDPRLARARAAASTETPASR